MLEEHTVTEFVPVTIEKQAGEVSSCMPIAIFE